jgi:hypothetical protein
LRLRSKLRLRLGLKERETVNKISLRYQETG